MLYEIWLDDFRFPVRQTELNVYEENDIASVTIDGFGEISKTTNMKLRTFEISSFFYDPTKPKPSYAKEYTRSINTMEDINWFLHNIQRSNKVVPFKIFGMDVDTTVQISKYEWISKDGTGDMYYNITLIECKELSINEIKVNRDKEANFEIENVQTHTVKSGDTLYNIAKKYYGDGSRYMEIAEKNGIANPNLILDGRELKL
ncbi:Phage protein [Candidatus Arthromitus sp. SFB-mouse-NL]|uniref:LysM peptidoglycan-binding domain-containing protein n=1 Tax=Candidatus Arthromitus sp. SFB-mouse-NL TaxID=1508644 RepID=UPI00049A9854|nr:LysM peptidoglycan-binding domain-containing protein [Candidatus Arthromitus sp. SFB-mouse-NL]AID44730.1 Phage protein [Candidatus Arthromitus sp. SFB-mouse-NL]